MLQRLVVINDRSVGAGGASALAVLNALQIRGTGLPVTYLSGDDGNAPMLQQANIEVIPVGGTPITPTQPHKGLIQGLWNTRASDRMHAWIQANDTPGTVYHLHGWSKILSPSVFRALRHVSDRLVVHAHDFFLACPNGAFVDYPRLLPCSRRGGSLSCLATACDQRSHFHKLWRFARHEARQLAMSLPNRQVKVLLIHEKMRGAFERDGLSPEQLEVLLNPVEPFTTHRVTAERNKEFYFIGRLVPEKGIAQFLEATSHAGVSARVIGDGPLLTPLSQQYPHVKFEGWRNKAEVREIIDSARAVVMPTLYPEPYGLVAVEALGSGIPVLISDQAFLAHEITSLGMGKSFSVTKPSSLLETLRHLAHDHAAVEAMSIAAFTHWTRSGLRPDAWRDRLLATYHQRLKPQRSPA